MKKLSLLVLSVALICILPACRKKEVAEPTVRESGAEQMPQAPATTEPTAPMAPATTEPTAPVAPATTEQMPVAPTAEAGK